MLEKGTDELMARRVSSVECLSCSRYLVISGKATSGFRVCLKAPDGSFFVIEAIDWASGPGSTGDKSGWNAQKLLPMRINEWDGSLGSPEWICTKTCLVHTLCFSLIRVVVADFGTEDMPKELVAVTEAKHWSFLLEVLLQPFSEFVLPGDIINHRDATTKDDKRLRRAVQIVKALAAIERR